MSLFCTFINDIFMAANYPCIFTLFMIELRKNEMGSSAPTYEVTVHTCSPAMRKFCQLPLAVLPVLPPTFDITVIVTHVYCGGKLNLHSC
jgi:hypothetical protein